MTRVGAERAKVPRAALHVCAAALNAEVALLETYEVDWFQTVDKAIAWAQLLMVLCLLLVLPAV